MKKAIKYRTTLPTAALLGAPSAMAADCLFMPSTSAGDVVPDRTVAASATSVDSAALASAGRGGRDGTGGHNSLCNLWPSSAYSVRSRTVAPIVADPSGAFGVGYVSATGADRG